MIKLSKNNVDKMGIITYNKDTLKNGHQTDRGPVHGNWSKVKGVFQKFKEGGDSVGYN